MSITAANKLFSADLMTYKENIWRLKGLWQSKSKVCHLGQTSICMLFLKAVCVFFAYFLFADLFKFYSLFTFTHRLFFVLFFRFLPLKTTLGWPKYKFLHSDMHFTSLNRKNSTTCLFFQMQCPGILYKHPYKMNWEYVNLLHQGQTPKDTLGQIY